MNIVLGLLGYFMAIKVTRLTRKIDSVSGNKEMDEMIRRGFTAIKRVAR
jgi:hypothetical protein